MEILDYKVPVVDTSMDYFRPLPDWRAWRREAMCEMCQSRELRFFGAAALLPINMSPTDRGAVEGFVCEACGWWSILGGKEQGGFDLQSFFGKGELSTCEIDDPSVPSEALVLHLRRRYEDVRYAHPRSIENLVGSVFREHYDCTVEMTKQTRDGGKDLVCFNSNQGKFYVEVKNPQSSSKNVDVAVVQRFVGVLYQDQISSGILVSSSDFTADAMAAAESANQSHGLIQVDLKSRDDILAWLDVLAGRQLEERFSELSTVCSQYGFEQIEWD